MEPWRCSAEIVSERNNEAKLREGCNYDEDRTVDGKKLIFWKK